MSTTMCKPAEAPVTDEMPWLVFLVSDQAYAVNSRNISSIFQRVQPVLPMPQCPDSVRGVIHVRGEVIPLVDLRCLLGIQSFAQEHKAFCEMIDARKQDHITWVDELTRCVEQDRFFALATDPKKCAFGRWYSGFHTDRFALFTHLKKIDEPHSQLHRSAEEIFRYPSTEADCMERRKKALRRVTHDLMPKILGMMEDAKEAFKKDYREMCIVLLKGDARLGILVDSVRAVESLTPINEEDGCDHNSQLVSFVARGQGGASDNVLVINEEAVFQQVNLDEHIVFRQQSKG